MAKRFQIFGKFPSDGEVDPSEVKALIDEYMEENPQKPHITINGEEADENGNFTIKLQAEVTNNVVEF